MLLNKQFTGELEISKCSRRFEYATSVTTHYMYFNIQKSLYNLKNYNMENLKAGITTVTSKQLAQTSFVNADIQIWHVMIICTRWHHCISLYIPGWSLNMCFKCATKIEFSNIDWNCYQKSKTFATIKHFVKINTALGCGKISVIILATNRYFYYLNVPFLYV